MTDSTPTRWLIVCDCAGLPEELVGVVDVDATTGKATVWSTGRGQGSPSLQGANRLILNTRVADRGELLRSLKAREIPLRVTVTFSHGPCGKKIRVNDDGLGELLAAVSKAVAGQRVSLAILCAVNGRLQRGGTR